MKADAPEASFLRSAIGGVAGESVVPFGSDLFLSHARRSSLSPSCTMSTTCRTLLSFLVLALFSLTPAFAQSNSDSGGSGSDVSGSDVAGVLSKSAATQHATFKSPAIEQQVNQAAASLQQRLNSGILITSTEIFDVPANSSTAASIAELLGTTEGTPSSVALFVADLKAQGIPSYDARAFASAVSGLLSDRSIDAATFMTAVDAYNSVVEDAPADFVQSPPASFMVVRDVLAELIDASSIE